jgi:hypothetical protein
MLRLQYTVQVSAEEIEGREAAVARAFLLLCAFSNFKLVPASSAILLVRANAKTPPPNQHLPTSPALVFVRRLQTRLLPIGAVRVP